MPRGILRNKSDNQSPTDHAELDRQEVIRNTRLNAQLASESSKGDRIRAKLAEAKKDHGEEGQNGEHLKWDEINLYKTEQEKNSTMKIDEPKTPYEGGFDPEGEYYKEDVEEIPEFSLGKGELDFEVSGLRSLGGSEVLANPDLDQEEEDDDDEKEQPEQLTAEERHHRFEEKRKEHYHLKGLALHDNKVGVAVEDEE